MRQSIHTILVLAAFYFTACSADKQDDTFDEKTEPDEKAVIDHQTLVNKVAAVLRLQPKTPIMVRGDKDVLYGKVVVAMGLLQRAGAPSVGLITEAPEPINATSETNNDNK